MQCKYQGVDTYWRYMDGQPLADHVPAVNVDCRREEVSHLSACCDGINLLRRNAFIWAPRSGILHLVCVCVWVCVCWAVLRLGWLRYTWLMLSTLLPDGRVTRGCCWPAVSWYFNFDHGQRNYLDNRIIIVMTNPI